MAYQDDGLSQFGYMLGREVFGGRRRERQQEEELKKLLQQLRPSTEQTLTGQTQLGPVQQEPSFDIMGQVNQPRAPTMLSDQLTAQPWGQGPQEYNIPGPGYLTQPQPFEYDIPGPGYLSQPTPSRATFGAEALFPSDEPVPVEYPAGHPMHAYELDAQRRALQRQGGPRISDMTMRGEPEPEYVGGATAQLPPEVVTPQAPRTTAQLPPEIVNPPPLPAVDRPPTVTGPDVVPEYLRRPDTTEAPPDTFVPGGQRVTRQVPGKELLDVIAANPQVLPLLKAYPGLLTLIEQERTRQQWKSVFGEPGGVPAGGPPVAGAPGVTAGVPAPGGGAAAAAPAGLAEAEDPQVVATRTTRQQMEPRARAIMNSPLAVTPEGKAYLENFQKAVTAEDAAIKNATEGRKAKRLEEKESLEAQEKADAKQWALDRAAELRAGGDERGARIWEARAKNPKYAEDLIKERELELRERELTTKAGEPTKDRMLADAATYQLQQEGIVAPSRGQVAQRSFELSQKTDAATAEQTIRQAATKRLMDRGNQKPTEFEIAQEAVALKKELATASAATTTIKIGAEERAANIMNEAMQKAASQDLGETRPDGTPGMLWDPTYTQYMGPKWFIKADERYAIGERLPAWMPGSITTKQGAIRAALESLGGRVTRALNGARASDKDMELTAKFTPQINDRPEVAQEKYRQVMEYLRILEEVAARQQGRPTYFETQNQGKRQDLLPPPREGAALPPPTPPGNPPLRPPPGATPPPPGAASPGPGGKPAAGNEDLIRDYVKPPGSPPKRR